MYFLGVDGGGTKTEAIISDIKGRVIGHGLAGNGNYQIDEIKAKKEIESAVLKACKMARISVSSISYACFGLAGADKEHDIEMLKSILSTIGIDKFEIKVDAVIGLKAGVVKGEGIAIVCGTSTNAVGVNHANELMQLGGFGYTFGDYGGGEMISKEIFRFVMRVAQGREDRSLLVDYVLKKLNFTSLQSMHDFYINNRVQIPLHLSTLLFKAAAQKDVFALGLIERQAKELAVSVKVINNKLFSNEQNETPVVLIGSLVTKPESIILQEIFHSYLLSYDLSCKVFPLQSSPVIGASLFALENYNTNINEVKQMLEITYKEVMDDYEKD
ncbi:BadF/BadG/BcrA/BcrD ATPase family protein [Virgibacillus sp. C22-A2]|uniref:BadF/BadG/BcrA/BcrD ATPase family protein n=1 Tax=Virgibacillus tibetensis TaxID=3042313 RepID=A0ABU6KER0_9BACI|nr:BadF/BadG/BcrA/BcrD ATPase family protein [Virgibacillus sp. C22-A2]